MDRVIFREGILRGRDEEGRRSLPSSKVAQRERSIFNPLGPRLARAVGRSRIVSECRRAIFRGYANSPIYRDRFEFFYLIH